MHRPSRFGNELVIVKSSDCEQLSRPSGGAAIHWVPERPIVAPLGLRLLLSVRQMTFSKSICNVTSANNQIALWYRKEGTARELTASITPGLYSSGASIADALEASLASEASDPSSGVFEVGFDEISSRFTIARSRDGTQLAIESSGTTIADLLGLSVDQLDVAAVKIVSSRAANLSPCSAFLVKTNISCSTLESGGRGDGVIARVPTIGLLNSGFVFDAWAPFESHTCLLQQKIVDHMQIELLDATTYEHIVFADERPWSITMLVDYVHQPEPIQQSAIAAEIGLTNSLALDTNPDATHNEANRQKNRPRREGRESNHAEGTQDRKPRRKGRRGRRNAGGSAGGGHGAQHGR